MQSLRRRVWATRFFENSVPDAFDAHFFNGLLDIYTWLAYRLHRIQGGPVAIPWAALMGQFAHQPQGLHAKETFRRGFLHGLHKVQMVYPQAKVEPFDGGLALHASPPPVAKLKGGSHE